MVKGTISEMSDIGATTTTTIAAAAALFQKEQDNNQPIHAAMMVISMLLYFLKLMIVKICNFCSADKSSLTKILLFCSLIRKIADDVQAKPFVIFTT